MTEGKIRLDRRGAVAVVTIERPQRRNTFNEDMFNELAAVTEELQRRLPRVVVLTGYGNQAFSAGFDVNPDNPMVDRMAKAMEKKDPAPAEEAIRRMREVVDAFVALPVPIIAALNGLTYGGGAELATRCDLRVMDPEAVICFSEVKLGLMPDWGGGATLARLVGSGVAADLILTARKVRAQEAFALGLVNRVSMPGQALEAALEIAEQIAKNGPRAVSQALNIIRQSRNLTLKQALDLELERAVDLIASGECVYGISAFLERKEPEFPDIAPSEE